MGSFARGLGRKGLGQILDDLIPLLLRNIRILLKHFQYFILPFRLSGALGGHALQCVALRADGFHQFFARPLGQRPRGRLPGNQNCQRDGKQNESG